MDPNKGHKKEACDVPACPKKKRDFKDEAKTLTKKIDATDCKCAAQLYGSTETTADTAVKFLQQELMGVTAEGKPCKCKALAQKSSVLRGGDAQPVFSGKVNNNAQFAVSAQDGGKARPPNYRSAWDDCGGVGASATERMRTIASKIKGWAKPLPFVRHAAQDCDHPGKNWDKGTVPGPSAGIVYPGPEIPRTIRDGLSTAAKTLAKYPAAKK